MNVCIELIHMHLPYIAAVLNSNVFLSISLPLKKIIISLYKKKHVTPMLKILEAAKSVLFGRNFWSSLDS